MTIRRTITLTFGSGFTLGDLREFCGAATEFSDDTPLIPWIKDDRSPWFDGLELILSE